MKKNTILFSICIIVFINTSCNNEKKEVNDRKVEETVKNIAADTYMTNAGNLKVTLIGHASLMFQFNGQTIHVDPYSNVADYARLPKADLILLTHEHSDHLDTTAINRIKKAETQFIVSKACNDSLGYGEIMKNGDKKNFNNIEINAVSAYNIENKRPDGELYHPKGRGNGYVLTFDNKKIYIAGDTENIPEMKALKDSIYIAFLPKNLPYTMTDDMFTDAAKTINPVYLYPYHFSKYDDEKIDKALKETNIKVMLRPMSNL